jgi:hypothetical protein
MELKSTKVESSESNLVDPREDSCKVEQESNMSFQIIVHQRHKHVGGRYVLPNEASVYSTLYQINSSCLESTTTLRLAALPMFESIVQRSLSHII